MLPPLLAGSFYRLNYICAAWRHMNRLYRKDLFNFFSTPWNWQQASQKSLFVLKPLHIQPPTVEFPFKMAVFLCHVLICIFFYCCMVPTFPSASGCVLGCSLIKRFSKPVCNGQNYTGHQGLPWITYSVPQGLAFTFMCYYLTTHWLNRVKCNEKTSEGFWHPLMFIVTDISWNLKCIFSPRPAHTS